MIWVSVGSRWALWLYDESCRCLAVVGGGNGVGHEGGDFSGVLIGGTLQDGDDFFSAFQGMILTEFQFSFEACNFDAEADNRLEELFVEVAGGFHGPRSGHRRLVCFHGVLQDLQQCLLVVNGAEGAVYVDGDIVPGRHDDSRIRTHVGET